MSLRAATANENGGRGWGTPPEPPPEGDMRPIAILKTHNSKLITFGVALLVVGVICFAPVPPLILAAALAGLIVGALLLRYPVFGAYLLVLSVPVQKAVSYNV